MSVNFIANSNLADINLEELATNLTNFHQFIVKNVSEFIGTKREYNKRFIKIFESDGERFSLRVNINKNRVSDLIIEYILTDSLGNECVTFDNDYSTLESLKYDFNEIETDINKIKG